MQNQTLTYLVKLMERGLIVIPKTIREKVGLEKGSYMRVIFKDDEIVLKPLSESESDPTSFLRRGIRIEKTKYGKKEGIKILAQIDKPLWSDKDDAFSAQGRRQIAEKLKKNDQP